MEVMDLVMGEEDAKDWVYKGEGAASIVLSYIGHSVFLLGKVLRIRKVSRGRSKLANGCSFLSGHEILLWKNTEELVESTKREIVEQVFMMRVMGPLLDTKHVDEGILVMVSCEFLDSVAKSVHHQRPPWRIDISDVDTFCNFAMLFSDHSVIVRSPGTLIEDVCFAVEIKPKCGFLPYSEFIANRNAVKKHVTRFRMHQTLKLHKGEISKLSEYNPLDLFSGKRERIYQAIIALFDTPQNNLRIFVNGSLIYGGLGGGIDNSALCFGVGEIENITKLCGLQLTSFLELITEAIFSSAVLEKLLVAQKLDVFDIEGAIHAYYNIVSQPCSACKNSTDPDLHHRYSFLHALSMEESLKIVRDYLIAATAKDCSVMICFKPMNERSKAEFNTLFLKSCNRSFEYKVNFIDLDMKPLEKMVYYYELDQKIVNFFASHKHNVVTYCNSTDILDEGRQLQY